MVIINSRQDQAKRIGYYYAFGLLIMGIALKLSNTNMRTAYTWMFAGALVALYSITTIPRKSDGARAFYESSKAELSERMNILALGPAIMKRSNRDNCMGALVLTPKHLEFRSVWERGICDEAIYVIDLMAFRQIESGKRDTIIFPADALDEELSQPLPSGENTITFMVNKPELWKKEIYKARV